MSFFEAIWFIVISFAFIAYLMMLFSIVTDLFRDQTTSGGAKAVWMVCLCLFPLITAIAYLITRGDKMAARQGRATAELHRLQEDYVRSLAGSTSPVEQIAQAKQLLDGGAITGAEYDALKAKALG